MEGKNVHTEHCCRHHGCKYCDENCPVVLLKQKQSYKCEDCADHQTLVSFIYLLGRDYLPLGKISKLLKQSTTDDKVVFTNKQLEEYAIRIANKLSN